MQNYVAQLVKRYAPVDTSSDGDFNPVCIILRNGVHSILNWIEIRVALLPNGNIFGVAGLQSPGTLGMMPAFVMVAMAGSCP